MKWPKLSRAALSGLGRALVCDLIASLFLGVSVVVFAVGANFTPGGVTGLAVLANFLFGTPIGLGTLLVNIPIVLATFRRLGPKFFLMSAKTMVIGALVMDYAVCWLPVYGGPRLIASILSGLCAGVGYSLIFNADSSTGGTDFIIVAVKQARPRLTFGLLAFVIDSAVIVASVFVFGEVMAFVYGMVYTAVTSLALDATTRIIQRYILP